MKEEKQHKMSATYTKRFPEYVKWLLLLLFTLSMFVVAMTFGAANVSIHDVYTAIFTQETSKNIAIIREIRLPRELAALRSEEHTSELQSRFDIVCRLLLE